MDGGHDTSSAMCAGSTSDGQLHIAETAVRALCARVREAELASRRSVLIHLGVDASLTEYHLERTAFNEKTFRVPDASGYQPTGLPICAEDGGLGCFLRTAIPVDDVVTRLRELGHPCAASDDAGRYLCNYIYYASLRSAARCTAEGVSCASLFVHVPPFAVIDEATQTLQDILQADSLDTMNSKIDELAMANQITPALILTASKAHMGVKESPYTSPPKTLHNTQFKALHVFLLRLLRHVAGQRRLQPLACRPAH